ncbi:MAG: hypothetical protein SGJ20_20545 [Planctomycetota bacterium]|nr:hypothetical protein [Planctomycetota bacterium]
MNIKEANPVKAKREMGWLTQSQVVSLFATAPSSSVQKKSIPTFLEAHHSPLKT